MRKITIFQGFTLAELIVVITILAILATVGFLALSGYSQDAKSSVTKTNVRSVYSAITAESASTGNSPRYYVIHDPNYSLSGGIVTFDGNPTSLSWGDWNVPGTNYSAGNPDYVKLKMNKDKFKVAASSEWLRIVGYDAMAATTADPAYLLVWAVDGTENVSDGKKRVRSFVQVVGIGSSQVANVTGNFPTGMSGSVSGLVRDPASSSSSWAIVDSANASSSPVTPILPAPVWSGSGTSASPWKKADGSSLSSCNDYRTNVPTAPYGSMWSATTGSGQDGAYSIDPDGAGAAVTPYVTYCDMTIRWGGWTLLISPQLSGPTYNRGGSFYSGTAGTSTNFTQTASVTLNSGDLEKSIKNLGFRYIRIKYSADGNTDIVYESSNSGSTFAQKKTAATSWLPAGTSCRLAMGMTGALPGTHSYYDVDTLLWNDAYNGVYTYTEGLLVCPYVMAYGDKMYVGIGTRSTVTTISSVGGDQVDFASGLSSHRQGTSWYDVYVK